MSQRTTNDLPNPTIPSIANNGEPEVDRLRKECDRLRRSLAEAEAKRDDFRHLLYAHIRESLTEEDKAELEREARDVIENGGVPFRDVLDELLKQSQGN